ncbi:MAG: hypothetical protein P0Y59_21650 [Candidatus Sphingomonas phytovorans]|nr:hypothetical protein [Sphingomonas sp.]WEJ99486.1 MAG: hypothetical protein P0Y59_21650 [Sphingomonas sp.]
MKEYFRDVQGRTDAGARFETDFEQFYLCLMVGLEDGRLAPESELEPAEFTKDYTAPFQPFAPVLAGLLVDAQLRRQDIPRTKESLQQEVSNLIDVGNTSTRLNPDATKLLSRYAARGFTLIQAAIPKPRTLEDFLVAYHLRWSGQVGDPSIAQEPSSSVETVNEVVAAGGELRVVGDDPPTTNDASAEAQ